MSTTDTHTKPVYTGIRVGRGNLFAPTLPVPPEWTERALCARMDPDLFFPEDLVSSREAKAVCGRCPVRPECLAAALDRRERFGVWGGLSERERRALLRPEAEQQRTREFDAKVAELTAAGWMLAAVARRLETTERRVSRARARLRARTTTDTTQTTEGRRAAA